MEKSSRIALSVLTVVLFTVIVGAQVVNPTRKYCFNFSWLGPRYNNESTFNDTCEDITQLANNIPCKHPLVTTYDGTYPDINFLWENHDGDVTCLLVDGEVCAKYIYRFDGFIQNVTFMCAKVVTNDDTKLESGCFVSKQGSREVEVCMCRTVFPGSIPCNSSPRNLNVSLFCMISLVIATISNYIFNK